MIENSFKLTEGNTELTSGSFKLGEFWSVGEVPGVLSITYVGKSAISATVPVGASVEIEAGLATNITITSGTFHRRVHLGN